MKVSFYLPILSCLAALGMLLTACLMAPDTQEATTTLPAITASASITQPSLMPTESQPTASPTTAPTEALTPTTINPGQVRKDIVIEVKQSPEVACSRSEIWQITSPYTSAQPILRDEKVSYRSPRWSHDGSMMAYIVEVGNETHIELKSRDSDSSRLSSSSFPYAVTESSCNGLQLFSWSPSSRWLAFEQVNYTGKFFRYLYVFDTSSGQSTLVDEAFYGFPPAVWSPDGDILAYVHVAYDASGRRVNSLSIKLAQIESEGIVLRGEIPMPGDFDVVGRGDRIRGLVWHSDDKLFAVATPTIGDDPARLYEVDTITHTWQKTANYERNIDTERYPPSQIYISANGHLLAWAANDLFILDSRNWHEVGRLQANWLGEPVVTWISDSNNRSVLVFYDAGSFWVYDPDLSKRESLFSVKILSPELTSVDIAVVP